jgi:hypothetical protein
MAGCNSISRISNAISDGSSPGSLNLQYDAAFETDTLLLTYSCGKGL